MLVHGEATRLEPVDSNVGCAEEVLRKPQRGSIAFQRAIFMHTWGAERRDVRMAKALQTEGMPGQGPRKQRAVAVCPKPTLSL